MAPSRAALQTLRRCAYSPYLTTASSSASTSTCPASHHHYYHQRRTLSNSSTHQISHPNAYTPRILNPSLWRGLVPKFLRRSPAEPPSAEDTPSSSSDATTTTITTKESQDQLETAEKERIRKQNAKESRFIVILSLMIGSWGINTLNLRRNYLEFSNETEAKLELLREVVRKVQAGEEVDVAKELGTGIEKEERAWEDVIKELEQEDTYIRDRKQRNRRKRAQKPEADQDQQQQQGGGDGQ